MDRYVALLRGINVSGRNRIEMAALRALLEELGLMDVRTLLNSGNVVFSAEDTEPAELRASLEQAIYEHFGYEIPVYVTRREHLVRLLDAAPGWWGTGDKAIYDNLILILSEDTAEAIAEEIGPCSADLERILTGDGAIYWSFDRARYQSCRWWKRTASRDIASRLTIRTADTIRKLCR